MTMRSTRRRFLARVGLLAALGAAAAACARYGEDSGAPASAPASASGEAPGPASGPGSAGSAGSVGLVAASTVPIGGGVVVADAQVVVTQPTAGRFAAFGTRCPHQGCAVTEVVDGTITCT